MTHTSEDPATDGPSIGGRRISRKNLLRAALTAGSAAVLVGSAAPALARAQSSGNQPLTPTPRCDDGDDPTPPQMEGPYFRPNSPQRSSLMEPGDELNQLNVSGYVFGTDCQPLANVLLDFWQADIRGAYDNVGYRYRGHQFTGANGGYQLNSVFPGLYPGRTRHLHVKVQAPGQPILTTQLYFPDEPRNGTDPIFDPALLMDVQHNGSVRDASFDFVLNIAGGAPGGPRPS